MWPIPIHFQLSVEYEGTNTPSLSNLLDFIPHPSILASEVMVSDRHIAGNYAEVGLRGWV